MITSVIFSKNRACQLDLLLRSIQKNLPNFQKIIILWHATNKEFEDGYIELENLFNPIIHYNIKFIQQSDFEQDTRKILNNCLSRYVCFFVDDNVIYRNCNLDHLLLDSLWQDISDLTCFSLRLGSNTVVQDQYNGIATTFPSTIYQWARGGVYWWNWTTVKVFGDFGYPFSVDGHIYKIKDLIPLLDYEFDTPNAFEGRFDKSKFSTNMMACFEESVLVNTPLNIVGSSNNNAGRWWGHSLEELNEKFLDNYQISLNSICRNEIVAAHQEIEVDFEKF